MTRIFQIGLLTEAFLNISGSLVFLRYPLWCLSYMLPQSTTGKTTTVPASAAVLWQIYAGLVLALTVPILMVVPESRAVYEKRDLVFKTLTAGEVALVGILGWHGLGFSEEQEGGFSRAGLLTTASLLLPALTWHSFAVWLRPDLMRPESSTKSVLDQKKGL
ncbi:hypothetical protein BKA67DRAFT_66721 [Truncatella angustata]|uniref:Uncharacterized protein n=1 Tax=Truncatella angustata TaxID=152316 RepID=A0A9P8UZ86_9PEZI|nr:uncharacterized protein BKA67DRAFT_66721 [Truncatella angustata]KAH6660825.1 hypothetical protein BKA67DRAFT_66721 [Truncatella angustata]KAH8195175.1 hypothetical protein TruAng_010665 [Truncatella angustata]